MESKSNKELFSDISVSRSDSYTRLTRIYRVESACIDSSQQTETTFVRRESFTIARRIEVVTAHDVALYILTKLGAITTMKLHKLLYYCQAWSLVWDEKPMFKDRIEAWANGPVVSSIFPYHRGLFVVNASDFSLGNTNILTLEQRETIDGVLGFYGDKSAQWLVNLTHTESPWIEARKGLSPDERGHSQITLDSMAEYYSGL